MKRILFLSVVACLLSFAVKAQEVIIGSGTSNNYTNAFYPYYEDSWWESVYTAAEIGMSGNITSVALQHDGGGTLMCQNVRIYMGYRTQGSYGSTSAWTPMSDLTLVYSATNTNIGGNASGWETFNLSTPFFYNGTDNLVIVFAKHATDYSSDLNYYYSTTSFYSSLYRYMDEDETYSQHPGSNSGSRSYNRPNTKLNFIFDPNYCGGVVNLQASGITTDEATISWNTNLNPNTFIIQLKQASQTWDNPAVETYTTADTTYTIFGLNPSSTYDVRVANDCGSDTSVFTQISFNTLCAPTSALPIQENFDYYTHTSNSGDNNLPNCWDYYNAGSQSSNHPFVYTSSNAYSGNYFLRFYTGSGTGYADQYAFMPSIDINTINIQDLTLGLYMRRQGNSGTFRLVIGVTEGTDLSTFVSVDTLVSSSSNYAYYTVSFSNYSGNGDRVVLKAFKPSSGNNRGLVDNIELGTDLCATPSNLTMVAADQNSITLQWTENGTATSWQIEYGPVGFTTGNGTTIITSDNPCIINGLDAATIYQFLVQADCGSNTSDWTAPRNFNTTLCDTADQCAYTFVLMDDYGDGWNGASLTVRQNGILVQTMQALDHNDVENSVDTVHVMLCNNIPASLSWSSGSYDEECTFQVIDPMGDLLYSVSDPSAGTLTSFTPSCIQSDCPRPTYITVTEIGATTATVSWGAAASETMWNVEYRPVGTSTWTIEPTMSNPHYLAGLTPSTQYEIRVQTDCGYDVSAYRDGSFSTAGCELENQCPYEFVLTDDFGDGWNGASLSVQQNGISLATMTISGENTTATFQVLLCDSLPTSLVWTSGEYDSECSFVVYNTHDSLIYSASSVSAGTLYSFISDCSAIECPRPASINVTNIESTSATIGWTTFGASVGAWNIEYKPANTSNWILETAYTNPYNLTGLTPSTIYDVRVQSDCGGEVSDWRESSFATAGCDIADQCAYTFNLSDMFGDGWNNASLAVQQNGITVANVTLESGSSSATVQVPLCDNLSTALVWNTGEYDDECSFTVTSPYGETIYTSSNLTYGTLMTFTTHCTPPTCPMPTAVSVSNIGTTTATVSWVSAGTETAWNVEYKVSGSNSWTVEYTTTNPLTLSGLTASTSYDLRVQADCGGGDLSDYRETTFNTSACEASDQCTYTLYLTGEYDDSWENSTLYVQQNGISVATIDNVSYSATVPVALCNGVSTSIVFYPGFFPDECSLSLYAPDGSLVFNQSDMEYYSTYTFTPNCSGSTPLTCEDPTNLNATATAYNAADVSWAAGGSETAWNLQYKTTAATNWSATIPVAVTNYQLSGLTAETAYQVRVQAVCDNNEYSDWTTASFTTPAEPVDPCNAPTNLQVGNITENTATVTWTPGGSETAWNVQYKLQSASQWQEANIQQPTYEIEGLTATSTYDVRVKAICAADNQSSFVSTTFTTDGVGIDNITLANSINLMPNPADNYIELRVNSNVEVKEAVVYNAFGQMIQTVQLTENHARIDLSNMAAGMYFVRVNGERVMATKKFIRK